MKRRFSAAVAGAGTALLPLVTLAATPAEGPAVHDRALATPGELDTALLATVLGVMGLFLVTALGYLYRRERNLDWPFQAPAAPHDDHSSPAH